MQEYLSIKIIVMKKIKLTAKSFKWLLCGGLVLLIVPVLVELLCFNSGFHYFGQNGLFFGNGGLQGSTSIATNLRWGGMGLLLVMLLLVVPVVEELAFRLWAIGKNVVFFAISLVLVAAYMLFVCGWVWAVVSAVALCIVFFCTKEKPCARTISMLVVTSALFSVAYCLGCEAPIGVTILDMLKTFGFGIVAGCLVLQLRFGLLWAVIAHIAFNAVNIAPMFCQHTYETDEYTITAEAMLNLDKNIGYNPSEAGNGFFVQRGDMQELVTFASIEAGRDEISGSYEQMAEKHMSQTTFYQTHFYQSVPIEVTITDKKGGKTSAELNQQLMSFMLDKGIIAADTAFVPMQYLYISDPELFSSKYDSTVPASAKYACSVESLVILLRFVYNLPLQPAPDVNYLAPCRVENKFLQLSADEAAALLKDYGIAIKEDPHSRAQVIRYKYFW